MPTSTISSTITDLNGTALSGVVVVVRLRPGPGFRITDASEIAAQDSTTTDGSGFWTIDLERNSNIDPSGSYYEVEEQIPESNGGPRHWAISVGASNQTLYAALVAALPAASGPTYLTQASADARYQALGSYGTVTLISTTTSSGISTAASRGDHVHSLDAAIAGDGLAFTAGVVSVDDDGVTLAKLGVQARGLLHHALYRAGVT